MMTIFDFCKLNHINCYEWETYFEIRSHTNSSSDSILSIEKKATVKQFLSLLDYLYKNWSSFYRPDEEIKYWFATHIDKTNFDKFIESNSHIFLKEKAKKRIKIIKTA